MFTLGDCLSEAVKLIKNSDSHKYGYSGCGIRFDVCSQFTLPSGEWGKNDVTFCVGNSLSLHANNRKKDILVLGKGPTVGLDDINIKTQQFIKANDSEIKPYPFCLGNISKSFTDDNMKITGLIGKVYNFSVTYETINDIYIRDIQKVC